MKKMKGKCYIKIGSHESFVREFKNILSKLDRNIAELAQFERVEMDGPSPELVNKLNRLKYHRKKLKMMLALFASATEGQWAEVRGDAQKIFARARQELLQPDETIMTPQDHIEPYS